jgi:tetratricopeptide (TPR) repeat protein
LKTSRLPYIFVILALLQFTFVKGLVCQTPPRETYQDYFGFARFLYFDNDYQRAVNEFNKALHNHEPAGLEKIDSIHYFLGMSYARMNQYNASSDHFSKVSVANRSLYGKAVVQTGKNKLYNGEVQSAVAFLQSIDDATLLREFSTHLHLLLAGSFLMLNEPKLASTELLAADRSETKLGVLISDMENFSPRSPALAGMLSALVPGTGKFYTGNIEQGLTSLFTIGLFGYRTFLDYRYNGINSPGFWVFGLATLYFYSGNIYGSMVSARIYNHSFYHDIRNKVIDFLDEVD